MTKTQVKAHTRGKDDPFAPVMEAKRATFARKWGVELVGSNDDRLSVPVADPVLGPGRPTLSEIADQLMALARRAGYRG